MLLMEVIDIYCENNTKIINTVWTNVVLSQYSLCLPHPNRFFKKNCLNIGGQLRPLAFNSPPFVIIMRWAGEILGLEQK
jgi:hypothetical protein